MGMRAFTCTDHDCVWPVGVASVVVASDEAEARVLLDAALVSRGLKPDAMAPYSLQEVALDVAQATVLLTGDY